MSFFAFALLHGLIVDQIHADDRIKRCGTVLHPHSKNGAYWFDGQRGWVYLHDGSAIPLWWHDEAVRPWSDVEKREWVAKRRETKQAREADFRRACASAAAYLDICRPSSHAYLNNKSLPHVQGLVNDELELFVPMRDFVTRELVGGQVIKFLPESREWQKRMLFGMPTNGAVFRLGPAASAETWLVEGYASGLTLELALRQMNLKAAVLICFSVANLTHIAPMLPGRKFAFATHDKGGAGKAAAKAAGIPYCMSPVEGENANDLYARAGLLAVCRLMMSLRGADRG